jgi:hypothetical protein
MSDPPRLLTLAEAAKLLSPSGHLTARSLRTMARHGRLTLIAIAGRHFVTESAINEMVATAAVAPGTPCRDANSPPDSICAEAVTTDHPSGSFSTERARSAQAQALLSLERLRKPSGTTLPVTTGPRVVPIGLPSCSSRK